MTDRQTDRRTDGQTDGRPGKNNMSPDPKGGRHNLAQGASNCVHFPKKSSLVGFKCAKRYFSIYEIYGEVLLSVGRTKSGWINAILRHLIL